MQLILYMVFDLSNLLIMFTIAKFGSSFDMYQNFVLFLLALGAKFRGGMYCLNGLG